MQQACDLRQHALDKHEHDTLSHLIDWRLVNLYLIPSNSTIWRALTSDH